MVRKLIYLDDAVDATWEEPTYTDPINVLTEVRDRIKALPSAQPDLLEDGTLLMTVPQGMLDDVKRVLVDEVGTKNCKMMYQDAERKKGKWIDLNFKDEMWGKMYECSICGEDMIGNWNFCCNCGADMRGDPE